MLIRQELGLGVFNFRPCVHGNSTSGPLIILFDRAQTSFYERTPNETRTQIAFRTPLISRRRLAPKNIDVIARNRIFQLKYGYTITVAFGRAEPRVMPWYRVLCTADPRPRRVTR